MNGINTETGTYVATDCEYSALYTLSFQTFSWQYSIAEHSLAEAPSLHQ